MQVREKFQALLREIFQFDCADLDFGIYRIMNYKRQVIEKWITKDLPRIIFEELQRGALAEQAQAQKALHEARQEVLSALGDSAIDAEGNLAEIYHNTPTGKKYLEAQARAAGPRTHEALETAIYNHLYTFFSRYWQDGDFISKRRYSKKERYAIPYTGEEVYLYWANRDQYQIKTGEHFTDYTYKASNGVTVHFKLQQANVEQNNVKGEKRFKDLRGFLSRELDFYLKNEVLNLDKMKAAGEVWRQIDDDGQRYLVYRGVLRNGRTAVIIWRKTKSWTEEDYKSDRDFVAKHRLTEDADEIFVNDNLLILGAQSLDTIFKERMFAGVEA